MVARPTFVLLVVATAAAAAGLEAPGESEVAKKQRLRPQELETFRRAKLDPLAGGWTRLKRD